MADPEGSWCPTKSVTETVVTTLYTTKMTTSEEIHTTEKVEEVHTIELIKEEHNTKTESKEAKEENLISNRFGLSCWTRNSFSSQLESPLDISTASMWRPSPRGRGQRSFP